ncbi:hypothetical protein GCM10009779_64280 [Polymorphospora rubra]|uniref:Uncharacterized protein n=1 Tax=Polymorphospora rubra TaxID=338584 RepID=A0A810N0G3_9ACTN|nr:hypothetical protein Prubr_21590 [Polymorphospora rubra]
MSTQKSGAGAPPPTTANDDPATLEVAGSPPIVADPPVIENPRWQTGATPVVEAVLYPPHLPGRTRAVAVVEDCPHCGEAHILRPADQHSNMSRVCPVRRLRYIARPRRNVRRRVRRAT